MRFCSLYSGSSGNSIYLEYKNTKILIDCGVSGRKIAASLQSLDVAPKQLSGILITHEHSDHIRSAGALSRMADAPLYASGGTWRAMESTVGRLPEESVRTFVPGERFALGDIVVEPFSIPHDAADPVAYNFYLDERKVTLLTDVGCISQGICDRISGAQTILLEANHDVQMLKTGRYPAFLKARIAGNRGHLSNVVAGKLLSHLVKTGTKSVLLGHLSKENNTPQTAMDTVVALLSANGVRVGSDLALRICGRSAITMAAGL